MLEHLKKYQILLASNSPRRQELLTQLGISFTTFVIPGIDESFPADLADDKVAAFITRKKAQAYLSNLTTAFGIFTTEKSVVKSIHTQVEFATLTREMIEFYVDTYKPYDKAGSYGIQEWIGSVGIVGIHGSYVNVMGLPIQSLYETLCSF